MALTKAYKEALEGALGDQCLIYHYNDPVDLEKLWSDDFTENLPILLIWDRERLAGSTLEDDRLLQPHLTPLDWALAWSMKKGDAGQPIQVILIIDLTAGDWKETWAWRVRHQLLADMPWVKLSAPVPRLYPEGTHGWTFGPHAPEHVLQKGQLSQLSKALRIVDIVKFEMAAEEATQRHQDETKGTEETLTLTLKERGLIVENGDQWTLNKAFLPSDPVNADSAALQALGKAWASFSNENDDQHNINNIVSAHLLGAALSVSANPAPAEAAEPANPGDAADSSILVRALQQKIAWIKLFGQADDDITYPIWRPGQDIRGNLTIHVYDDMIKSGWEMVLKRALESERVRVVCEPSPENLIKRLGQIKNKSDGFVKRDFLLGLPLDPEPSEEATKQALVADATVDTEAKSQLVEAPCEVILLDIRLYAGKAAGKLKEHIRTLVAVARAASRKKGLAWQAIGEVELKAIDTWLNDAGIPAGPTQLSALLLLPRLLALAFPLTPIIIFSATAQPRAREILKPYGNILTGFKKPNPLVEPGSLADSLLHLMDALVRSEALLRRRQLLVSLQRAAIRMENDRPDKLAELHADLYFDETGNIENGIISACAFVVHNNEQNSINLQGRFLSEFDKLNGVVWAKSNAPGNWSRLPPSSELRYELSVKRLSDFLDKDKHTVARKEYWSIFALRCPQWSANINEANLSAFVDENLDRGIRRIIEICLTSYVYYITNNIKAASVSIHLPTRVATATIGTEKAEHFHDMSVRFQLSAPRGAPRNNEVTIKTYVAQYAFPLVKSWLQLWDGYYRSTLSKMIVRINGRPLAKENIYLSYPDSGHLFHDVADWIAGSVALNGNVNDEKPIRIKKYLAKYNLFQNRYVSAATLDDKKDLYKTDFEYLETLLDALKLILVDDCDNQEKRAAAVQMIDEYNTLHRTDVEQRLENSPHLRLHRLVIWRLFPFLQTSSGAALLP